MYGVYTQFNLIQDVHYLRQLRILIHFLIFWL